jgi:hypothetical protein
MADLENDRQEDARESKCFTKLIDISLKKHYAFDALIK